VDEKDSSPDCVQCFNNALSGPGTGTACSPASDPDCGDCAYEWTQCVAP
jgi:hypothetical protein